MSLRLNGKNNSMIECRSTFSFSNKILCMGWNRIQNFNSSSINSHCVNIQYLLQNSAESVDDILWYCFHVCIAYLIDSARGYTTVTHFDRRVFYSVSWLVDLTSIWSKTPSHNINETCLCGQKWLTQGTHVISHYKSPISLHYLCPCGVRWKGILFTFVHVCVPCSTEFLLKLEKTWSRERDVMWIAMEIL